MPIIPKTIGRYEVIDWRETVRPHEEGYLLRLRVRDPDTDLVWAVTENLPFSDLTESHNPDGIYAEVRERMITQVRQQTGPGLGVAGSA